MHLYPVINTSAQAFLNFSPLLTAGIFQNYFINPFVDSTFSGLKAKKVKLISILSLIGFE